MNTLAIGMPAARRTKAQIAGVVLAFACLALLICVPWISGFAAQRLLVEALTLYAIALSWNLLAGYGGMVAVGHHAFVGIGAYALFYISNRYGINPWAALLLAGAATAVLACAFAWPLFRLSGANFAVGTWVLAEMLRVLVLNSEWLGAGAGMPLLAIREFDRASRNAWVYWSALAVAAASLCAAHAMLRGRLGLALRSLSDTSVAASACGVPVAASKLALWVAAATMAGLASGVAYMNTLQVSPDASFSLNWTAAAIFIVVLGGIGTLEGPLLGVVIYFVLREFFAEYGAWYFIGLGLLAMAVMVGAPGGLWGLISRNRSLDLLRVRRRMPANDSTEQREEQP